MDPITMAMMEEAAAAFMKDQAMQAMGPELATMGGANAMQSMGSQMGGDVSSAMGGDVGGLLGQTQNGSMSPAMEPQTGGSTAPALEIDKPTMMSTLQTNVMSDINKSPYGQAYNTFTNPNATTSDYTSLAYKTAFSPEAEKQNQVGMGQMPSMPMGGNYGGGRVSTTGGIPDLLKKYGSNSGLLQYLG